MELKNGETYNGQLVNCDPWMNLNLRNVVCTAREGDRFWKLPAVYVRGNTIKYLCVPDEVLHLVNEEQAAQERQRKAQRGRGGRGGRGGTSERGGTLCSAVLS